MTVKSITKITENCFKNFRKNQMLTVSEIVFGLLKKPSGRLTDMARGMGGSVKLKSRLRRIIRFLGNEQIIIEEASPALLSWLLKRQGPLAPIVVLMDWTKEHGMNVLTLSLKWGKRSLPFYWHVVEDGKLTRSRNSLEATAIRLLRHWVGDRKIILIADRGFSRSAMYKLLKSLTINFIIRIPNSPHMLHHSYKGSLKDVRVHLNKVRDFQEARLGADAKVPMRIIIKKAKIKRKVTTWYLGTDLDGERAATIIGYYERRMGIEATFKDLKSSLGWGKQKLINSSERLSRYLLLLVTGLIVATIKGESKTAFKYKELLSLKKIYNNTNTVSSFNLGLMLIQNFADKFTTIYLRKGSLYAY